MNEKWGKFTLTRLIAIGGMAEVFEATEISPAGVPRKVCL
jgi:hypothetical protein